MKKYSAALCGLLGLLLAGCAAHDRQMGKARLVSSLPDSKPDWVAKASYEADGRIFYKGAVTGRQDMALGLRESRGEAEKKLAEEIRSRIRTEFGSAIEGQNEANSLGAYLKDIIAKVSDDVEVSGVSERGQYVEKWEVKAPEGVRYQWDCYSLLSISREDYLEARRHVQDQALRKVRDDRNAKAEASLKDAFGKLEAGSAKQAAPAVTQP